MNNQRQNMMFPFGMPNNMMMFPSYMNDNLENRINTLEKRVDNINNRLQKLENPYGTNNINNNNNQTGTCPYQNTQNYNGNDMYMM